jgi:hypothetical protein
VDDSQSLISVKSVNFDDQINTGPGYDISHNQNKRPFVEDDKSSSTDQSSNEYDSDMYDVGATPSRGKNAKSLLNLQQRTLPTAKNRSMKTPNVASQYQSASESDSDNDDVGAQPPIGDNGTSFKSSSESDSDNDDVVAQPSRGKNGKSLLNQRQRIVATVQNLGSKSPRLPPQHKYHSVFQTFPRHLLAKIVVYSESNYRGDHKFFLPLPLQSNSSIHIEFQDRVMECTQGHQYCIFLNFRKQHW